MWVPFAIILFGANTTAILFVIVMTAAPAIANGLIAGADFPAAAAAAGGQAHGAAPGLPLPARDHAGHIPLPAYVNGLKQGWVFGWHGLIAAEIVVIILGQPSLGMACC